MMQFENQKNYLIKTFIIILSLLIITKYLETVYYCVVKFYVLYILFTRNITSYNLLDIIILIKKQILNLKKSSAMVTIQNLNNVIYVRKYFIYYM